MKSVQASVREWTEAELRKLPQEILDLIREAKIDLYYGPTCDNGRPFDFTSACRQIADALSEIHAGDIWVDGESGEVFTSEPDGEYPDVFRVEGRVVKSMLVGKELFQYV